MYDFSHKFQVLYFEVSYIDFLLSFYGLKVKLSRQPALS